MLDDSDCSKMKILVATDGSKPSEWAIAVASKLAEKVGGMVVLLHVIPKSGETVEGAMFHKTEQATSVMLEREGMQLLQSAQQNIPESVRGGIILKRGDAASEIQSVAREQNASLIVMGARGQGRFAQFVLGSTAETVIRKSSCPVITVSHEPTGCGCKAS